MKNEVRESDTESSMGVWIDEQRSAILTDSILDETALHEERIGPKLSQDRDDSVDIIGEFSLPRELPTVPVYLSSLSIKDKTSHNMGNSNNMEDEFLPVPMPTYSTGITTFAYQRVLRNRIRSGKLARGSDYDTRAFTPTFVHDCLMLPGSLANVLGKGSSEQIVHRMTPALMPGFKAHVHMEAEQPCLIQSDVPKDYVQGVLIFGEGKYGRHQIHKHYRPYSKRIKVQVETEITVPVRTDDRRTPEERWMLKRKRLWAHAWLWSNVMDVETQVRMDLGGWKLEDYLAGEYAINQALRVEDGVSEDYEVGDGSDEEPEGGVDVQTFDDSVWVPGPEPEPTSLDVGEETHTVPAGEGEKREDGRRVVPEGGIGGLSYERSDDAVGWW